MELVRTHVPKMNAPVHSAMSLYLPGGRRPPPRDIPSVWACGECGSLARQRWQNVRTQYEAPEQAATFDAEQRGSYPTRGR